MNICKNNYFNTETLLAVFDTCKWCSKLWCWGLGLNKALDIRDVNNIPCWYITICSYINFCKRILGLRKSTCNSMVYRELGRYPMVIVKHIMWFRCLTWSSYLNVRVIKTWGWNTSKKYYFENPSVFKLIKLLNSQNVTERNNLRKCIVL